MLRISHRLMATLWALVLAPAFSPPAFAADDDSSPLLAGPVVSLYAPDGIPRSPLFAEGAQAFADVNGDGILDVAALVSAEWKYEPGLTVVMLGRADGSFELATQLPINDITGRLALADLSGDGELDLVFKRFSELVVLFGDGEGGFALSGPSTFLNALFNFAPLNVVDFDMNAGLDVVLSNTPSGGASTTTVELVRNLGGGTLSTPELLHTESGFASLSVGDFDTDGVPDLLLYAWQSGELVLRPGTGSGSVGPELRSVVGTGYNQMEVADLDADGDLDLTLGGETGLAVLLGDGAGGFGAPEVFFAGTPMRSPSVGDLDGDGFVDLVVETEFAATPFPIRSLVTIPGLGGGSFGPIDQILPSFTHGEIQLHDINGDGSLELIRPGPSLNVYVSDAAGRFRDAIPLDQGGATPLVGLELFDTNADGDLDVLGLHNVGGDMQLLSRSGDSAGNFGSATSLIDFPGRTASHLLSAQLNADALTDLVAISNSSPTRLHSLAAQIGGGFSEVAVRDLPLNLYDFAAGDLDGNGTDDLVTSDANFVNLIRSLSNDGSGTFTEVNNFDATVAAEHVLLGAITGGPDLDLVLAGNGLSLSEGLGDGSFGPEQLLGPPISVSSMRLADFNTDGALDLFVVDNTTAAWIYPGLAGGGFGPRQSAYTGTPPALRGDLPAEAVDLNGDGLLDIVLASGQQVLLGDGALGFTLAPSPWNGGLLARFADLNGNGRLDTVLSGFAGPSLHLAAAPSAWCGAGGALPGLLGAPSLRGIGSLDGGSTAQLNLSDARPLSSCYLVLGVSAAQAPFKGGVLVPNPDKVFPPKLSDALGTRALALPVPNGLPSGVDTWWQYWIADPAGPLGYSASNAQRATTP